MRGCCSSEAAQYSADLREVLGQQSTKRALEVAVRGRPPFRQRA